jgi:carbon-monoxide dehydrogenase large subunit
MRALREEGRAEIGRSRPREATRRLLAGRGSYVDDVDLPGQLHAAFFRSPYPHAEILHLDLSAARTVSGVGAVLAWSDIAHVCKPWQTVSASFPGLKSPTQYPLAAERVTFQGEPVCIVLAASRAIAEDAVELIEAEFRELEPAADYRTGLEPGAALAHPELGTNLAWSCELSGGDVDTLFASAATIVEEQLVFTRHTGVPLEARSVLASYEPGAGTIDVRISNQVPHQLQVHLAEFLGLPMSKVRVVAPDVGGGFGIKMHVYPDEVAVCAASHLLARPVKFVADRIESMLSDVHAREHVVHARMALDADGLITALDIRDLHGLGAYSVFPRSSTMETMMALRPMGAAYRIQGFRAKAEVVLQNKAITGQYRSVGHPIATTVTETLVDLASRKLGEDPLAFRRRNYLRPEDMPVVNPAGLRLLDLSHEACLDKLVEVMSLEALRREIGEWRRAGRVVGLGFAAFVEMTASGSEAYGRGNVQVAAVDTVTLSLEPDGSISGAASVAEIGQGIAQGVAQVVADAVGVPIEQVGLTTGDTRGGGHGGGAWASRGAAIGGEAAWEAGRRLRAEILRLAASLLQARPEELDVVDGAVRDQTGAERITLADLAETVLFRGHDLPPGTEPQLSVAHHYRRARDGAIPTNGIQASLVEIDPETGIVSCLKHWVVEDCGRIINPLLVDGQIRGGVVQGIGEALLEACRYDEAAHFTTATLTDYLVPMAGEMPDIVIGHVETPYSGSALGAKGAGEAGTCGAGAAVLNAVNDALAPFGARIVETPIRPELVLRALGSLSGTAA